jgi:hypothetical protein
MTVGILPRAHRLGAAVVLATILFVGIVGSVSAASPSPSGPIGGDPRSAGQGPGLVGDPASAIVAVVVIGLGAAVLTLAWVKLTGGRRT